MCLLGQAKALEGCLPPDQEKAPEQNVLYGAFMKNLGNYLLSHMKICSIIGEKELNFRVRNG
ncbi:hypothetical protein B5F76_05185, partial [Desulfovibrio sp. An276]